MDQYLAIHYKTGTIENIGYGMKILHNDSAVYEISGVHRDKMLYQFVKHAWQMVEEWLNVIIVYQF